MKTKVLSYGGGTNSKAVLGAGTSAPLSMSQGLGGLRVTLTVMRYGLSSDGLADPSRVTWRVKQRWRITQKSAATERRPLDCRVRSSAVNTKKGQKMKRLYQNWPVHNLIGHPLMQIFELLGMSKIATRVHDETLPSNA